MIGLRVAARHQRCLLADQPPGARQHAKHLTKPINAPRGISREIVHENGQPMFEGTNVNRRDIQPKDVFNITPNRAGVLNLVETGRDLQTRTRKDVSSDKGYAAVSNLSQYLIRTEGGAGTPPEGS